MRKTWNRLGAGTVALMLLTSGVLPIGPDLATVSAEARTVTKSASYMTTYVTKKAVDMKAGKHKKNKTLNTIPKGKTVTHVKSYGSWTQVKYGAKTGYVPTSSLGNKKVVTVKPAPKPVPKPAPGLSPAEKDKALKSVFEKTSGGNSGGQYELTHYVAKTGQTLELGGAGLDFPTNSGYMSFDVGLYNAAVSRSDVFGKEAQEESKKLYTKYNNAIYAFATSTVGKQHGETLRKELEKLYRNPGTGSKKVTKTIGGKTVILGANGVDYTIEVK